LIGGERRGGNSLGRRGERTKRGMETLKKGSGSGNLKAGGKKRFTVRGLGRTR